MNKTNLKNFGSLVRFYTAPMSLTPLLIAFCVSFYVDNFGISEIIKAAIAAFGILCAHLFVNLFDDYIDVKRQLLFGIPLNKINFKSKRKARTIIDGTFSINYVEKILISLGVLSALCGIYFLFNTGLYVLIFIIPAIILALFYPISSKFGLSELTVGLMFGPLLMNGAYFVITGGYLNIVLFILSIITGIITSILLITHSIMDFEFDKPEGKKTIPVILNSKKNSIILVAGLIIISYIMLMLLYASNGVKSVFIILIPIISTAAISIELIKSLFDYINIKDVKFNPKWHLGTMENWEEIKLHGFDFYMYRFYLARNLSYIFNISIALALIINYKMYY